MSEKVTRVRVAFNVKQMLSAFCLVAFSGALYAHNHISASDYRDGVPRVLKNDVEVVDNSTTTAEVIARFKKRYAKKEKPRIIVFWNRVVSDNIDNSAYQSSVDSMALDNRMVRIREEFFKTLLDADVQLVDRSIATRKSAVAEDRRKRFNLLEPSNAQTIEMAGLERYADAVVEVRPYVSRRAAQQFRIKMMETISGVVAARFNYKTANISENEEKLYVTERGYEYRRSPISAAQVGEGLALEFLSRYRL